MGDKIEGFGKSLIPHTQSSSFPLDEPSESRDKEGWPRLALQGDPERTRKLLPCDVCSLMFCAGVGWGISRWLVPGLHVFLRHHEWLLCMRLAFLSGD